MARYNLSMNLTPRPTWLAGVVAAAAGATIATVMLTGSHAAAPAASAPAPIVVKHVDAATVASTPAPVDPTAAPTPVPAAATPTAAPTLIACGNGQYAQFACKRDVPTAAPTPTADPWAGWETTQDGHHRKWCDYAAAYVFEDSPVCTATDNPATRAHARGN